MAAIEDIVLQVVGLVVAFAATFAVAAIGSKLTFRSLSTWYNTLRKPSWTPSGRTIGAIWSVLYVLMALAAWLVWREAGGDAALPLAIFAVQLALNLVWTAIFFGMRNLRGGLLEIVVLWVAILATVLWFLPVSLLAGALLVPYLAWVTIAGSVNFVLWRMNPRNPESAASPAP